MSNEIWILGAIIYIFIILKIGSNLGDFVVRQRGGNPHDFSEGKKSATAVMWAFAFAMYFIACAYGLYLYR